ncbi:kinetochore Sim4 complex subunit FTA2-domain-containing protein [Biscogniauxia sp. FL1348]|nr:kinetochore Sim4 complex subunit FTA2-domain-containing protein [Biscogniauxia sp. FL1348]
MNFPPVPGPSIPPFHSGKGKLDITFIQHIGAGIHSHVWKVKINGAIYALKIFTCQRRFNSPEHWGVTMTEDEIMAYLHPFGCEARAYGRLKELGLDNIVAAQCYGYLILNGKHRKLLRRADRSLWEDAWGSEWRDKGDPISAIVKEFVEADKVYDDDPREDSNRLRIEVCMDRKIAPQLIKNLKKLHQGGILLRDINQGNIIHGRFIDFSTAWTVPHPVLTREKMDKGKPLSWDEQGYNDACELDDMIDIWNKTHDFSDMIWERALPNKQYRKRLRLGCDPKRQEKERPWTRENNGWRIRPERYDWEAAEKERQAKLSEERAKRKKAEPEKTKKIKKEV